MFLFCSIHVLQNISACKLLQVQGRKRTNWTESEKADAGVCIYSHICGYIDTGVSLLWYEGHLASQQHLLSCSDNT